jgi:excisionase family DNA binding protein
MAQGYYTLEEAAQFLGMTPEQLKQLAKKGEIRYFPDRGTWRFRSQDIQEMARQRGVASDTDLPLGEASKPRPTDSPAPKKPAGPDDSNVEIGQDVKKPGSTKKSSLKPAGSDSDVRLVADGSDLDFQITSDSDVKMVDDSGPSSSKLPPQRKTGVAGPKSPAPGPKSPTPKRKAPGGPENVDSGVRLVPMDSDSDVKIVGTGSSDTHTPISQDKPKSATDSDIRIDPKAGSAQDPSAVTEEIDLDAASSKFEEAAKSKPQTKTRPKAKKPELPTSSPFELSEDDLNPEKQAAEKKPDSSSDFDLTPAASDKSPLELGSDEFQLDLNDDAVGLGDAPAPGDLKKGAASGINLQNPADSGISLEQGGASGDEIEFELTLDSESTPKPAPAAADSDSEFELTLDDSGGLAPLEEEASASDSGQEKDIFETDFEVPALEDESGSQAVAVDEADTDLDSSDFDLALGDEDIAADEESGSQVVALEDEEEVDDAAATVAARRRGRAAAADLEEEEDFDLGGPGVEEEVEEEVEGAEAPAVAAAPPAEWGAWSLVLIPSALVLLLAGIMGFEMVQSMVNYKPPGPVTKMVGKIVPNVKFQE